MKLKIMKLYKFDCFCISRCSCDMSCVFFSVVCFYLYTYKYLIIEKKTKKKRILRENTERCSHNAKLITVTCIYFLCICPITTNQPQPTTTTTPTEPTTHHNRHHHLQPHHDAANTPRSTSASTSTSACLRVCASACVCAFVCVRASMCVRVRACACASSL